MYYDYDYKLYDEDDDDGHDVKPGNLIRDINDLLFRGIEAQHQQSLNIIVMLLIINRNQHDHQVMPKTL